MKIDPKSTIDDSNAILFVLSSVDKIYTVSFDESGLIKLSNSGIAEAFRLLGGDYAMYTHHRNNTGPYLYIIPGSALTQFKKMMQFIADQHAKSESKIVSPTSQVII